MKKQRKAGVMLTFIMGPTMNAIMLKFFRNNSNISY